MSERTYVCEKLEGRMPNYQTVKYLHWIGQEGLIKSFPKILLSPTFDSEW